MSKKDRPQASAATDSTGQRPMPNLSKDSALKIMRGLAGCNLIGMDIVEVSPPYDHDEIIALAAATLGLELLYVLAANRRQDPKVLKEGA